MAAIGKYMRVTDKNYIQKDVKMRFFFFFSSGPRAYAPDALQPVGLLCYPSVF
jgi:hypothetical protein